MRWLRFIERPRLLTALALAFALVPVWLAVVTYRDAKQKDERVFDTTAQVLGEQLQTQFERHTYFPREVRNLARDLAPEALRQGRMLPAFPWQKALPHLLALAYADKVGRQIIVRWKSEERVPVTKLGDDLEALPGVLEAINIAPSIDPNSTMGCIVAPNRMLVLLSLPGNRSGLASYGYIVAWIDLESLCHDTKLPLLRDNVLSASPLNKQSPPTSEMRSMEISDLLAHWTVGIRRSVGFSRLYGASSSWLMSIAVGIAVIPLLLAAIAAMQARHRGLLQVQAARLIETNEQLIRFKAIADTTSDLVAMCELDTTGSYMNPAGRAMLGIGPEDEPSAITFDRIYPAESLQIFASEAFKHAMETGPWSGEITMQHLDGHSIPVSFVGFVVKTPEGRPLHMGCIARDISERFKLDQQLRETLEQQRELVQLKSQFISSVSHEFRTPLGIIHSGADLLDQYAAHLTPERRSEVLHEIRDNTRQMSEMVEQVLLLGRMESSSAHFQPKSSNLATACHDAAQRVAKASRAEGRIHIKAPDHQAMLDLSLLGSILENLLSNALKYSATERPVTLEAKVTEQSIIICVRDEGIGIPTEDLARVCDPFHRSGNVGATPGSGLGLAIAHRCASLHGGTLIIESQEGQGTVATLTLPASNH